ncbi:MAG TPA: type 2 isopentenyl-diphosphate Delta-isomerase, partial [Thermoplasmata archaeon]|nr:type 2 isopentenyl-diphosphate Delta-isomerase [Thermoplasmata archaeon]
VGMTGGYPQAEEINRNLAEAAAEAGVGLGVGSQRAGLEQPELAGTYSVVREFDVPLVIGNIGAPQLVPQGDVAPFGVEEAQEAMKMIGADVLAIHLNYMQEAVQGEGDRNAAGCLDAIRRLAAEVPVIVKETGSGLSPRTLALLEDTGIRGLDVGGLGGTSFSAVETHRAGVTSPLRRIGTTFWDWGIPTPVTLALAARRFECIATGGVRHGLDVARGLAMGGRAAGMARALLRAATESASSVIAELEVIRSELVTAMFLTGSATVEDLRSHVPVLDVTVEHWIERLR